MDGFNALFSAASASPETSEEHLVDALTKLLLNRTEKLPIKDIKDDPFGKVWISPGDFSKRTPLDNRTVEIENKIKKLKNSGKTLDLALLIAQNTEAIVAQAARKDDVGLAYRYALRELNPFALIGGRQIGRASCRERV